MVKVQRLSGNRVVARRHETGDTIMEILENIRNTAISYYKGNGLPIPKSVVEYTRNYPPGLSRQVLSSKYNTKCSVFVKLLDPAYVKPLSASERAVLECSRLNATILTDLNQLSTKNDKLVVRFNECGHTHETTVTSLSGTKLGCRLCKSGNLNWKFREEELKSILRDSFNAELLSEIPDNQTGYVEIKHLDCGSVYTTQLLGIVSPNSKLRGTCPNCRSTDRRVVVDGETFGSHFEADCYKILKKYVDDVEMHIPYSKYFSTTRRWVCDFKIGNYWIEVSNFKQDFKNYFSNIEDKQALVESNGHFFFFVRTLKELEELATLL